MPCIILPLISLFFSCSNGSYQKTLPSSTGKTGEIIVVMEENDWKGTHGEKIRSILGAEQPALPQSEPLFTLIQIPSDALKGIFRTHRNILFASYAFAVDPVPYAYKKNVWAKDQVVVTLGEADTHDSVLVAGTGTAELVNFFRIAERDRIMRNYSSLADGKVMAEIKEKYDFSITVPKGYRIAKNNVDFFWLRKETEDVNQGIFAYSICFFDPDNLSDSLLKMILDSVCRVNVPGQTQGSYMMTMPDFPLLITPLKFKNYSAAEVRGLWQVHNDFMGGPFIALIIFDKSKNRTMFVEGYVFAPKYDKREYLRQVEAIIYSVLPV